jgi:hypothetical protein
MAFHQQRRHTEAREKQRGTEPDRAAAHNEDRDFNICRRTSPVTCLSRLPGTLPARYRIPQGGT